MRPQVRNRAFEKVDAIAKPAEPGVARIAEQSTNQTGRVVMINPPRHRDEVVTTDCAATILRMEDELQLVAR